MRRRSSPELAADNVWLTKCYYRCTHSSFVLCSTLHPRSYYNFKIPVAIKIYHWNSQRFCCGISRISDVVSVITYGTISIFRRSNYYFSRYILLAHHLSYVSSVKVWGSIRLFIKYFIIFTNIHIHQTLCPRHTNVVKRWMHGSIPYVWKPISSLNVCARQTQM